MDYLKTRIIKLQNPRLTWITEVNQILGALRHVRNLSIDANRQQIKITYNLNYVMLKYIESILEANGFQMDTSFVGKMKRSWQHFTEQNELDNLNVKATCCSNPDDILNKGQRNR